MAGLLLIFRKQILMKNCISDAFDFGSGVQQGSCLELVLLLIYAAGLFKIIDGFPTQTTLKSVFLFGRTHWRLRMLR